MEKFNKVVSKIMEVIFGLVGTAMIFVASYGVLARDVLHVSAPWTDEMLKLLDIWMIFVVSASVFYFDEQLSLTRVEDSRKVRSHPVVYHCMKIFQYVLAGIINIELIKELSVIIGTQIATHEVTTVMKYPLYILNMGMMIGCVLTVLFAVIKVVDQIRNIQTAPGFIE